MTLPKSGEAKKVNLDFNKEFISTFTQNIESRNVEFINQDRFSKLSYNGSK